ncbi:rhoGEF domain-containing protein gxcI [Onthophagus taurus]|uniref:rhoGEF domain-containing protein gxcI n=1 Tax=Onthophagus taurus TaxID=166361 RepID=UPI0039BDC482
MSRVERKEYQETKIMRTRSPAGMRGSKQNLGEFDNNLDYLLEDLQNSVSRPDSALGSNTYREIRTERNTDSSARSNSLSRITNTKAANPVTEYSTDDSYSYTSPDGTKSVKTVKKEMYSYKTSDGTDGTRMQNNINQLDSLLDDLQQVKPSSESYRVGTSPGYQEYSKSKVISGKTVVERDIIYPETPRSSRSRTLDRSDRENSVTRDIQYSSESTNDLKQLRTTSPSPSRSSTLSKQTKVTNVHSYPMEVVETTTTDINPEILANLDPNLLPTGNTKVTTTIKTYTYEIPGAVYPSPGSATDTTTEKYVYSPNQSSSTPSKSFVYNKFENNSLTRNVNYQTDPNWQNTSVYRETTTTNVQDQPYQRPPPPIGGTDTSLVKETVTTRNYQPGNIYRDSSGKHTYMYDENTTTRNVDGYPPHREPPNKETVIIKETHTTNTNTGPQYPSYPPQDTVIYRENTTSNNFSNQRYPRDNEPRYPKPPPEPMNITYKYSATSTTSNNYKGYPPSSETEPLLQPRPFPTDEDDGSPPKKLDELMATIGREPPNSPLNAGFNAHEIELAHQKKADNLRQQQIEHDEKKKEEIQRTKNVTGPPVYYPPGYEMFAKKEESGGGWRAEGAMAKESGKYEYKEESKTKTKAALVPVCLPLCCGLPCTIL